MNSYTATMVIEQYIYELLTVQDLEKVEIILSNCLDFVRLAKEQGLESVSNHIEFLDSISKALGSQN